MVKGLSLRAYAIALAIFVLGGVAGAAASYAVSERNERELADGGFEAFEQRRLRGLTRKLDLSDEQKDRVRGILREEREARRKLTREVFERCGEPLGHHRDQADARIRAVLNPEQQKRYDEIVRDHRHDPLGGHPRRGPGGR